MNDIKLQIEDRLNERLIKIEFDDSDRIFIEKYSLNISKCKIKDSTIFFKNVKGSRICCMDNKVYVFKDGEVTFTFDLNSRSSSEVFNLKFKTFVDDKIRISKQSMTF